MRFLVPLIVGVALGLGVGLSVGGNGGGELPQTYDKISEPRAEPLAADPTADETAEVETASLSEGTPTEMLASARSVIEELGIEPGDGNLVGSIATADGVGLAGVAVVARVQDNVYASSGRERKLAHESTLDEFLQQSALEYSYESQLTRATVSGEAGEFTLEGMREDTPYRLTLKLEGYKFKQTQGPRTPKAGSAVVFEATPLAQVRVDLTLPDGSIPLKGQVRFAQERQTRRLVWHRDKPVLDIEPGSYRVFGIVDDYKSKEASVSLVVGQLETLDLALAARVGLRGRITFPPGEHTDRAHVRYRLAVTDETPSPEEFGDVGKHAFARNGEFEIFDMPPGRYHIGIGRGWDDTQYVETVEIPEGIIEHEFVLPALDPEGILRVLSLTSDGTPLQPRVSLQIRRPNGGNSFSGGTTATKAPDGAQLIHLDSAHRELLEGKRDGQLFVSLEATDFGTEQFEVDPGQREYEVRFRAPGTVQVSVSGAYHELVGSLSASLASKDGPNLHWRRNNNQVTADGSAKLGPVAPGDYLLEINVEGLNGFAIQQQAIHVREGENKVGVEIPALYRCKIQFPREAPVDNVRLHRLDGLEAATRWIQVSDNTAQIEHLAAGSYQVHAENEVMFLQIPGPEVVEFTPESVNAVEVIGDSLPPSFTTLGLEVGDIITAIDKAEFTSYKQIQVAFRNAKLEDSVPVHVLRKGQRIVVEGSLDNIWVGSRNLVPVLKE